MTEPFNPSLITAETVDLGRTYTIDELVDMPDDALEELWGSISDKAFYETALEQVILQWYQGNPLIAEAQRIAVVEHCIGEYQKEPSHFPFWQEAGGVIWLKRSRSQLLQPRPDPLLQRADQKDKARKNASGQPQLSPRNMAVAAAGGLIVVCMLIGLIRNGGDPAPTVAELTATSAAATQLAIAPPSPTPLALEDIDRPISGGDELRERYPLTLEIQPHSAQARIFPVQQRQVEIAEWSFANDPAVASSVLGLAVRPVLGIPYTPSNQSFLEDLAVGDSIVLHMSTGQSLVFSMADRKRVERSALDIFGQDSPGIVVVLLAEPSVSTRLVAFGEYQPSQEIAGQPTPSTGSGSQAAAGLNLAVLGATFSNGNPDTPLPADFGYLLVDINLKAERDYNTQAIVFGLLDAQGIRYNPSSQNNLTDSPWAGQPLAKGEEIKATLVFLVPRGMTSARLTAQLAPAMAPLEFGLSIASSTSVTAANLDVILSGVETVGQPGDSGGLVVKARLYNPTQSQIVVRSSDVFAVYSPAVLEKVFPVGPSVSPSSETSLPITIKPGEALDIKLNFSWTGDPYVGLAVGGYRFVAVLKQS